MGAGRAILIATLVAALLSACGQAGASVRPAPGSVVAAPAPGGPLQSVDCVNATTCWAVGSNGDSPTRAQAVIEEYTGGGWAMATTAAAPAGHGYALLGVSCPSSGECWAVGTDSGPGGTVPLIEHHAGGSWSIVRAAPVAGSNVAGLRGVACAGSTDCWAVGSFGASPTRPLVEHFDGNRWTLAQPPSTPEAGDASLNAVTCQRVLRVGDAEWRELHRRPGMLGGRKYHHPRRPLAADRGQRRFRLDRRHHPPPAVQQHWLADGRQLCARTGMLGGRRGSVVCRDRTAARAALRWLRLEDHQPAGSQRDGAGHKRCMFGRG